MKILQTIAFAFIVMVLAACGKDGSDSSNSETSTTPKTSTTQTTTNNNNSNNANASNAAVEHYTCPNGHVGSGGDAQGFCSQCNAALVHNQEWHNQKQNTNPLQNQQPQTPPATSPAQNADGVWHYTCPNGHEGGAGAAQPCSVCGTTLAHNQAYHGN